MIRIVDVIAFGYGTRIQLERQPSKVLAVFCVGARPLKARRTVVAVKAELYVRQLLSSGDIYRPLLNLREWNVIHTIPCLLVAYNNYTKNPRSLLCPPQSVLNAEEEAGEHQHGEDAKRERETRRVRDMADHRRAHEVPEKSHRPDKRQR